MKIYSLQVQLGNTEHTSKLMFAQDYTSLCVQRENAGQRRQWTDDGEGGVAVGKHTYKYIHISM